MYEIHVQTRGPEGIRGFTQFRTTKAKSDELLKRIGDKVTGEKLIAGLAATEEELANEGQSKSESALDAPARRPKK